MKRPQEAGTSPIIELKLNVTGMHAKAAYQKSTQNNPRKKFQKSIVRGP